MPNPFDYFAGSRSYMDSIDFPANPEFAVAFAANLKSRAERRGGVQYTYRFPNGWGASVIMHCGSYGGREGLWELAVLNAGGGLDYAHPVSEGDVRGHLTDADVARLLGEIRDTPAA